MFVYFWTLDISTLLFIYLDKNIDKKRLKNLHTDCFKLLYLQADVEVKISLFLHVVVHEPFKGSMNYCFGSAWVQ